MRLYFQYVRSHLEYATPAWNPWSTGDGEALEKIQRKAVNMISGLSSVTYEDKLHELNIQSLQDRRERFDMIQTYKIMNEIENVDKTIFFQLVDPRRTANTRQASHHMNIQPKRSNLESRKNFFSNRVAETWNNLPTTIKEAPNLRLFKNRYDETWKEA